MKLLLIAIMLVGQSAFALSVSKKCAEKEVIEFKIYPKKRVKYRTN